MNINLLKNLTQTHSVTADTSLIKSVLKKELDNIGVEYIEDGFGSILFGNLKNPNKLIASHIDEVGFQVTKVEDNGEIRILPIGWIFPNRLDHNLVYIFANGKYVNGLVIHEEELKAENISDFHKLYIDIGVNSIEGVLMRGIKPGCTGSFQRNFFDTGDSIIASGIDNKVSQYAILEILRENAGFLRNNMFAFITDEEMQDHSANGVCHNYKPDLVVVLDYCPTHQNPGNSDISGDINSGPMVMYRGGHYIIHEKVRNFFEEKIKSKFQKGFLSSNTVPVLEPSNFEENGHSVAVNVCLPSRGYHGASYITRKKDIEDFINLIREILSVNF